VILDAGSDGRRPRGRHVLAVDAHDAGPLPASFADADRITIARPSPIT